MPSVTLLPTSQGPVRPGQTVTYEFRTSPDFPNFIGFDSLLSYDADALSFRGAVINPDLEIAAVPAEPSDAAGPTTLGPLRAGTFFNFDAGLEGEVLVATLTFEALAAGASAVTVAGGQEGFFIDRTGQTVFSDPVSAEVTVNTAPTVTGEAVAVDQGGSVSVDVLENDTDADGDALTLAAVGAASNGTVAQVDGALVYTPAAGFSGSDSFTYDVTDGVETATGTVQVTVDPRANTLNPVADSATVAEDGSVEVDVLGNDVDPDGDPLGIVGVSAPANGTAVVADGRITYTPDADFNGQDAFTYDVTDGTTTRTVGVSVTVDPVNDDPVAADDVAAVDEDASVQIAVLANDGDVDGDALTVGAVSDGANGSVTTDGATVTYTPDPDFNGTDSFTYTVSDGQGGSDTATVTVTVDPVTDPSGTVALVPSVTGFARPGDTVSFALVTSDDFPAYIGFETRIGYDADLISYDGATFADAFTAPAFPLTGDVTEPAGASGPITLQTVLAGLFAGTLGGEGVAVTPVSYAFTALEAGDATLTVDGRNGGIVFFAEDGEALFDGAVSATVRINSLALAVADAASAVEDGGAVTIDVLANDSDPDGDPLTVTAVGAASNGTAALVGGAVTYTPDADFNGTDSFTYDVSDGKETVTATVSVTVAAVNDGPVAGADAATVAEDAPATVIDVLGNDADADGDALTVASVGAAANGTVTLVGGAVTYAPDADFNGTDSFTYTVSDGQGGTDEATVTVTVQAVNDAPVAVDDAAELDENGVATIDVLANDGDVDGDALAVAAFGQASNGTAALVGGAVTYTPDADFNGTDSFTYDVSDGAGGTASATVTVTVAPVNDAPVLTIAGLASDVTEGTTGAVLTAAAADVDGDVPTITLSDPDTFVFDAATGEVRFAAPPAFEEGGANAFALTVTASDGKGGSDSAEVLIEVLRDTDGDGVADIRDNAIFVANPDQRDSNGDGYGNVIDADFDGDKLVGVADLAMFRGFAGATGLTDGVDPAADADFNGDGIVGSKDAAAFAALFATDLTGASYIDLIG